MSFDEQPDGDPHGECAAEIKKLQIALKIKTEEHNCCSEDLQLALAELEQLRKGVAMSKTCEVCQAEYECQNCNPRKDSLSDIEKFQPLGWITEETRQWVRDPSARGPGMFTANRNGSGGVWAIYSGADFQRLYILTERLKYELDEYTRGEREHLLRCKTIVKDLLNWYDNGERTMHELDRIRDKAADLMQR